MSENDLIRRGDAEALFEFGAHNQHPPGCRYVEHAQGMCGCDERADAIRALPADPVAEAAGNLAQATDAMEDECCGAGISKYLAAKGWTDSEAAFNRMLSALDAYRAAVAARAKETR